MLYSYLKIMFRNLRRNKGLSLINTAGLAVGLACCILILLYVQTQLGFDRYHEKADRVCRLGWHIVREDTEMFWGDSNAVSAAAMVRDFPEVRTAARMGWVPDSAVSHRDRSSSERGLRWADPAVFEIFSWPLLRGNPDTALRDPFSIVLTESLAVKYFGDSDPLGRPLRFNGREEYRVTGIMADLPENTAFEFDGLCSFETLYKLGPSWQPILNDWLSFNFETYLLLQEGTDPDRLAAKLPAFLDKYAGRQMKARGSRSRFFLERLTDIYLRPRGAGQNAPIFYVYIFTAIAIVVLLIACINFTNLATARSARRAREVGLRKVLGAERSRLTRQFLGEAVIFSLAGLALAVVVVELSAPFVSALAGVKLRMDFIRIPWLPFALFGLALFTGLTSGAYPAFVLSAYMPHRVLKDGFRSGRGGRRMRQVLVVSQFMVSAALIIGSTMIMNQLRYMKNKPAGFDREQVVAIRMLDAETRRAAEVFKRDFVTHPGVIAAAAGSSLPGSGVVSNSKIPEGRTLATNVLMDEINVDQDYLPTLGMELTAGRNFSLEFSTDIGGAVIINQSAARSLGWEDPIGKTIRSSRLGQGWVPMKVIGVVKDFHQRPMDQAIRPLFIGFYPPHSQSWGVFDLLLVRIRPDDMPETLAFLEDRWRELARQAPFDWFFLDEAFNRQFRNLERSRDIFSTFTFLGIFVACLGLFGMASYSAERRSREIGIRKVLGGSVPGLTMLLCRELGGLILLGNVIAWPLAYLILRHWLRQFPYRIGIGPLPFLLSTSLVLSLGLAVIAYQAVRAATTDPVKTLRYE